MKTERPWSWKNFRLDKQCADALGMEFRVDLFSAALRHDPENVDLLLEVGNLYTRLGCFQEGLAIDERLVRIRPHEAAFHYNLACSHALLEEGEHAFRALKRAIELGYDNYEYIQLDSDLDNLRRDPRYGDFFADLARRIAGSKGSAVEQKPQE
jgi:tetratricopeptide (TPR) repeat protein